MHHVPWKMTWVAISAFVAAGCGAPLTATYTDPNPRLPDGRMTGVARPVDKYGEPAFRAELDRRENVIIASLPAHLRPPRPVTRATASTPAQQRALQDVEFRAALIVGQLWRAREHHQRARRTADDRYRAVARALIDDIRTRRMEALPRDQRQRVAAQLTHISEQLASGSASATTDDRIARSAQDVARASHIDGVPHAS